MKKNKEGKEQNKKVGGQGELSSYLLWSLWMRPLGQPLVGEQVGRVM